MKKQRERKMRGRDMKGQKWEGKVNVLNSIVIEMV